jgi:hypothetical protein
MSASFDKKLEENGILNSIETVPKFLEWGKYSEQLSRFLFLFPRKNMLIKIYEDIEKDPFKFISEIYSFVGADQNFKAPSTKLRTKLGQLEHNSVFWGQLAKILLHPRAPRILSSVYTSIRPINQVQISDEIYSSFASYYRDDIIRLEEILGRDLNIWRTKGSLN